MLELKPDVFIGIDAPEFNLGLAPALHAAGLRTVQYVSPQVWAWRRGRASRMAHFLDLVLCLLPFERAGLRRGRPRGHLRRSSARRPASARAGSRRGARRARPSVPMRGLWPSCRAAVSAKCRASRLTLPAPQPGSRRAAPGLVFVAALAGGRTRSSFEAALARHAPGIDVRIVEGRAQAALTASDAVLVASGTATLETLLCKRPMVVAYRLGGLTAFLLRRMGPAQGPVFRPAEPPRRPCGRTGAGPGRSQSGTSWARARTLA
jgi:lipid-A-disaccharide synthase